MEEDGYIAPFWTLSQLLVEGFVSAWARREAGYQDDSRADEAGPDLEAELGRELGEEVELGSVNVFFCIGLFVFFYDDIFFFFFFVLLIVEIMITLNPGM